MIQLNNTIFGKIIILGVLIVITLYRPYIGLLTLLLIICLTLNREGFVDETKEIVRTRLEVFSKRR